MLSVCRQQHACITRYKPKHLQPKHLKPKHVSFTTFIIFFIFILSCDQMVRQEFTIDELSPDDTVLDLKGCVHQKTGVKPERQKLMGLKVNGKPASDESLISQVCQRPNMKIMMIGSKEEDIANVDLSPEDMPQVVNDFDIGEEELGEIPSRIEKNFLAKWTREWRNIRSRWWMSQDLTRSCWSWTLITHCLVSKKNDWHQLNLYLIMYYVSLDHRSIAECAEQLKRPFLHEFLESAYESYDIVIWCKN